MVNPKDKAGQQSLTCSRGATSLANSHWSSMPNLVTVVDALTSFDKIVKTPSWLHKALAHMACSAMSSAMNRASWGSTGCYQTKGPSLGPTSST